MANLSVRNLALLRQRDPRLGELLDDLIAGVNNIALQANVSPSGTVAAPPQVGAISVTAQGGIFDIAVTDGAPVSRGIEYFVEYSAAPAFTQPTVIHLGATRNWRGMLGSRTLYFRAYSQYATSPPSVPTYFGSAALPTPVLGGGATPGPDLQPSTGSGTAPTNGRSGAAGYGLTPYRGTSPPRTP